MAIIKSKSSGNFTVLPNEILAQGLELDTLGLFCHLLSLPNDWVIYKSQLCSKLNVGRDRMARMMKELEDQGYLLSVMKRDSEGKIGYDHIVYDIPFGGVPPQGKPLPGQPSTDNPSTANPPLLNTNNTKETLTKEEVLLQPKKLKSDEEGKEEKVPPKRRKQFVPPTIEEFQAYFKENGFSVEKAEQAWKGYNAAEWHDSEGKPVLNWKQKCHNVWFKPENKNKPGGQPGLSNKPQSKDFGDIL